MARKSFRVLAGLAAAGVTAGGLAAVAPVAEAVSGALSFNCTVSAPYSSESGVFTAVMDTDAPATMTPGQAVPLTVSSTVTIPSSLVDQIRASGAYFVDGTSVAGATVDGVGRDANLVIPRIALPVAGGVPVGLPASGPAGTLTAGAVGTTVTLAAGDIEVLMHFYGASGAPFPGPVELLCTLAPAQNNVVDTVSVVPAATSTTVSVAGPVEYGDVPTATADVAAGNQKPAGTVAFTFAGKTTSAAVKGGTAKADLAQALKMGANHVAAVFTPTDKALAPSQGTATFSVVRGPTTTTASAVYRAARHRLVGKATVAAVHGTDVAGKVKLVLKRDGIKVRVAIVDLNARDTAKKVFKHVRRAGQYTVVTRYRGSATLKRSSDRVKLTV